MRRFRHPQFRFSLRTFLIVCILPVPVLAWLANVKMNAVRQRAAIARLESQGIVHVKRQPPTPYFATSLIRNLVDRDAFDTVTYVYVDNLNKRFTRKFWNSDDFVALTHLKGLRDLSLMHRIHWGIVDHQQDHIKLPPANLTQLAKIHSLESLSIDADLDSETQLRLAQLPELHSLHLPGTQVTNEMLQALGENSKIISIDIDATLVTAKGLDGLAKAPALRTLMLRKLPSTGQLLKSLSKCKSLTHLQLHSTCVTKEDVDFINALPIQSLSLFHCVIKPGFFSGLQSCRTLTSLRIATTRNDGRIIELEGSLDSLEAWEDHFALKAPSADPFSP